MQLEHLHHNIYGFINTTVEKIEENVFRVICSDRFVYGTFINSNLEVC